MFFSLEMLGPTCNTWNCQKINKKYETNLDPNYYKDSQEYLKLAKWKKFIFYQATNG